MHRVLGNHCRLFSTACATLILLGFAVVASAVPIVTVGANPGTTQSIIGVTGFTTTGNDMGGMQVTAIFDFGLDMETVSWMGLGGASGEAVGTGWSLSQTGDTIGASWTLEVTDEDPSITSLLIEGIPGDTVFDRQFNPGCVPMPDCAFGTPDSFLGTDFNTSFAPANLDGTINATYIDLVAIGANPPVGDLYASLLIDFDLFIPGSPGNFGITAFNGPFSFVADTDQVGLPGRVPEPATVFLIGLGLLGLGSSRLRRR